MRTPEGEESNAPLKFELRGIDPTHSYVAERGISAETAATFGIGFYGQEGIMCARIVIPVHDEGGKVVAYAGRSIVDDTEPKYKFPDQMTAAQIRTLFGRDTRRGANRSNIVASQKPELARSPG